MTVKQFDVKKFLADAYVHYGEISHRIYVLYGPCDPETILKDYLTPVDETKLKALLNRIDDKVTV